MRWTLGLVLFFAVMFAVDGVFLCLAVSASDPIAASYGAEHR
jgi:hypothetical protein